MTDGLKLWLIEQTANNNYDTYDSAVVVAETADLARLVNPSPEYHMWKDGQWCYSYRDQKPLGYSDETRGKDSSWTHPDNVKVRLVGMAADGLKAGDAVCASFNAG